MSDILINEDTALELRKVQALELNIEVNDEMTQDIIEQEIVQKLEDGMKDLKNILDEINLLEV